MWALRSTDLSIATLSRERPKYFKKSWAQDAADNNSADVVFGLITVECSTSLNKMSKCINML